MADATNVFGILASFLSKLGFFLALQLGVAVYAFANFYHFESDNSKYKIASWGKLLLMLFAGLQLPSVLILLLKR